MACTHGGTAGEAEVEFVGAAPYPGVRFAAAEAIVIAAYRRSTRCDLCGRSSRRRPPKSRLTRRLLCDANAEATTVPLVVAEGRTHGRVTAAEAVESRRRRAMRWRHDDEQAARMSGEGAGRVLKKKTEKTTQRQPEVTRP